MAPAITTFLFIAFVSFTVVKVAFASDPDILTDYVLPPNTTTATDASYFTYTGVRSIVNTTYPSKFTVIKASLKEFPGLLGQSVSYAILQFPVGSLNPLHIHPRATELLFVIAGSLQVGFVDTTNTLFSQKLETGDMFVFPKGLVHYQYNNANGTEPALAVSAFGSASAGTQSIANSVFNSTIYEGILAESFKTSADVIEKIESGLKS
ncbi:putative germin, rmlC-like cupin domain superfamily, rmlC-like jelly roll [Helianthus anomalus]